MTVIQTVRLREIADVNPKMKVSPASDSPVAFVPMAAVDARKGTLEPEERLFGELSKGLTPFLDGDVLIAKITPCFENGKIAQARLEHRLGIGSTEFHVVRAHSDRADPRYLLHFLRQERVRKDGEQRMTGSAGQRRVPQEFISELEIPLPTLSEQRRIAAILDQADALRSKGHSALSKLDDLARSLFLELFGDPVTNPKGWPEDKVLGDVADIMSGITKGRKLTGAATREVPYLAVVNVQDRRLNLNTVKTIEATEAEISRYQLKGGDLLLTEGGDPDKLGRGSLWNEEISGCIHQNHIFRVRLTSGHITPLFLNWLIGSERGKRYFLKSAKQTTGIASINLRQLRAFPVLTPPPALQQQFAAAIECLCALTVEVQKSLTIVDALFASLLHRAFRGEL